MKITGLNHVAIRTADLDKSVAFYRDILGFKQLEVTDTEQMRNTMLKGPGGIMIELMKMYQEDGVPAPNAQFHVHHIAFDVDDVAGFEEHLRKAGAEIVVPCTRLTVYNTVMMQCKDPDGVILAFRMDM